MMDMNAYQHHAVGTAVYGGKVDGLAYTAMGLAGEAGEIANAVKKVYRDDGGTLTGDRRAALGKEAGDVLWYLAVLCHEAGLSLADVAAANLAKLKDRKARGVIRGSGDDR